jgi:hypothetical protein
MMNDEMENFEQRLQRQSLRKIPGEWRGEILWEGRRAAVPNNQWDADAASLPKLNWRTAFIKIFWPNPQAWAGLAAVWIFIFVVNFSMRDKSPQVAEKVSPPSPEVVAELRQQRLLFAQLIGASDAREAEPPKFFPRPRTERAEILTA